MTVGLLASDNLVGDLRRIDQMWNPPPNPYENDAAGYITKEMHEELWSKQREILDSVTKNRYTAVRSCHGPGKSFTASRLAVWWIATKADPFVVTSAPTSHQVRTILWREIRRAKKKAPNNDVPGNISQGQVPEWKINGEVVAFGRKPADYLDENEAAAAFQGIHAQNLLVILDEGSGIPGWLATACENLITNENGRLLVIGNPDNPVSWFRKCFTPGSGFNQIKIAASDTPAFTGERISQRLAEQLVSKQWVEERVKRWGKNSPLYKAKVDAEFPETADDVVFTPQHIEIAKLNDRSSHAVSVKGRGGFDVARLGPDECVVYLNRNGYVRLQHKWAKLDTMATVGEFRRIWAERIDLAPVTNVDIVGVGSGPYDRLKELGYQVIPFNGGEKAFNPGKYKNRRSEAFWEAREMIELGLVDIDEEDEDLQAELMEHKYKHTSTGQIQIEPKEDIAARLGRSPDRADAFVMSLQMQASMQSFIDSNMTVEEKAAAMGRAAPVTTQHQSDQPIDASDYLPKHNEPNDLVADLSDLQF
jgi:hypothetical protein